MSRENKVEALHIALKLHEGEVAASVLISEAKKIEKYLASEPPKPTLPDPGLHA